MIREADYVRPVIRKGAELLSILPATLVPALLEFAEHVAQLDVDYVIFMARKAVRLHDLLIAAGCRMPKGVVITDHVLDQSLRFLAGKRCALVDDTLIVGTTLADAEARLEAAGVAEIQKVVFAVDQDNWCKELCGDVRWFATLDERQMLNFCATEVEALALAGIPYLTDFPLSKRLRLGRSQLGTLYSMAGWDSYALTSELQERNQAYYYTHLPTASNIESLSAAIGELWQIVEIAKVRSFVFTTPTGHLARIIPIVTLKPLPKGRVAQLFETLLAEIDALGPGQCEALRDHLTTPTAQLRFLQYFLGLVVGEDFLQSLRGAVITPMRPVAFDRVEANRLFGPWLSVEVDALHAAAAKVAAGHAGPKVPASAAKPAQLPNEVVERGRIDLEKLFADRKGKAEALDAPENLFSDLVSIFVELRRQYELPARLEVRRLGKRYRDASAGEAPGRDRLKMGIPWGTLATFLIKRAKLAPSPRRSANLSLMLDALIDVGIAVPIIAERDGILFRAYRHGEDALFAEQEYALAFHVARGFLEGARRETVPRLTMEKLLVALIRVGVSQKFLTPHFGMGGSERVARIAFHRHGAVVSVASDNAVFADDRDSWLTRRLVEVGVIRREGEAYVLGSEHEAGYIDPAAIDQAAQLGLMFGMLNASQEGGAMLSQQDLTLLTTCPQARDAAGAILAEFHLFDHWFRGAHSRFVKADLSTPRAVEKALTGLTQSGGYHAFNSALFKLTGYLEGRPSKIVEECASALSSHGLEGTFVARAWKSIWRPIVGGELDRQRQKFEAALGTLGKDMLVIATGMFGIELALSTLLVEANKRTQREHEKTCEKILRYLDSLMSMLPANHQTPASARLRQRVTAGERVPDPARGYGFALTMITEQIPPARQEAARIDEDVRRYARLVRSASFQFALWFDIIDASGARAQLAEPDRAQHWTRIEHFNKKVDDVIRGAMRDARRQTARVVVVPRNLESKEDEKHILFSGAGGRERLVKVAQSVLVLARDHGLKVRMLMLPAGFAGSPPYEYHGDPTIQGRDFWNYGNQLRDRLRGEEGPELPDHSLLWLADELQDLRVLPELRWAASPLTRAYVLAIDERPLRVPVKGGPVRFARR